MGSTAARRAAGGREERASRTQPTIGRGGITETAGPHPAAVAASSSASAAERGAADLSWPCAVIRLVSKCLPLFPAATAALRREERDRRGLCG